MVELMMALAVLTVVMLAVIGITPASMALLHNTGDATAQLFSVQQKLDSILDSNVFISPSWTVDVPMTGVTRRWRGVADPYGSTSVQIIDVQVTWRQGTRTRSIDLQGMVAP